MAKDPKDRKKLRGGVEPRCYLTKENAAELQKKGAEQRRINRERRRNMQDIAQWFLNLPMSKANLLDEKDIIDFASAKEVNLTGSEAMLMVQMRKAIETGDTAAAQFIRDTAGEKPKEQIEVGGLTMENYVETHKPKF